MELEEFIDIALNQYIEQDIIRLDVSDTTKNRLKRDLRKIFKDEDLIHDIKEESIPRAIVEDRVKELKLIREEEEKTRFVLSYSIYNAITNEIDDLEQILNKGE